jgi:hypothetical protein
MVFWFITDGNYPARSHFAAKPLGRIVTTDKNTKLEE